MWKCLACTQVNLNSIQGFPTALFNESRARFYLPCRSGKQTCTCKAFTFLRVELMACPSHILTACTVRFHRISFYAEQ